jgi:hypothetical protein
MAAIMAQSRKEYEQRMNGTLKGFVHLPNYPVGPGRPQPIKINFYEIHDDYPAYLLCTYEVSESNYDASREPTWFEASLQQIRDTGQKEFPPIQWIAVIIGNRAEHTNAGNFEQSYKVGAIFKAADIFDRSVNLQTLITAAAMDRHPFVYDPQNGETWDTVKHQRWVIVERHAATTQASAGDK